jgi:transcription elongation factor B subunit 1
MTRASLLAHLDLDDSDSDSSPQDRGGLHAEEEEFPDAPPGPLDFVTLISKEGVRFHVAADVAKVSGLLATLLDPEVEFEETASREIRLDAIRAVVLEKVVDYMHYNAVWRNHTARMPSFQIDASITVETFVAADFLQL